jgi:hypothetical protein
MKKIIYISFSFFCILNAIGQGVSSLPSPKFGGAVLVKYFTQEDTDKMRRFLDSCEKYLPQQDSIDIIFFDSLYNSTFSQKNFHKDNLVRMQSYALIQKKFSEERKIVNDYTQQIANEYQKVKAVRDSLLIQKNENTDKLKEVVLPNMQLKYDKVVTPTNKLGVNKNVYVTNLIKPSKFNKVQRELLLKSLEENMRSIKNLWDVNLEVEHYLIDAKTVFQKAVEGLLIPYEGKSEEEYKALFGSN